MSLLISALYNIVDHIFIGNSSVGAIRNTVTTIVFPLTCIALAFGLLLDDGCAAYMSLESGKGEGDKIDKAVGTTIVCGIVISILFLVIICPLLSPILNFFGAKTEDSLKYSLEYGKIIFIGVSFYILMRADGSPKTSMFYRYCVYCIDEFTCKMWPKFQVRRRRFSSNIWYRYENIYDCGKYFCWNSCRSSTTTRYNFNAQRLDRVKSS